MPEHSLARRDMMLTFHSLGCAAGFNVFAFLGGVLEMGY